MAVAKKKPKQKTKRIVHKVKTANTLRRNVLIAGLVVLLVAAVGVASLVLSKAYTVRVPAQYVFAPSTEKGCWLAGRKWLSNNTCAGNDVGTNHACRVSTSVLRYMKDTDGTTRSYCTGAIALESDVSQSTCVNTYHRMFVKYIGCSRRIDQDNTNGARQCVGNNVPDSDPLSKYKNYIADGTDHCVAPVIATSPTVTETMDAIDATRCRQLGRVVDSATNKCRRVCVANAGTLFKGAAQYYCSGALVATTKDTCTDLRRVWLDDGCARRPGQDDAAAAIQCANAAYKYYNANFTSAQRKTTTDVCEASATSAAANEKANILGSKEFAAHQAANTPPPVLCANRQVPVNGVCVDGSTPALSTTTGAAPGVGTPNAAANGIVCASGLHVQAGQCQPDAVVTTKPTPNKQGHVAVAVDYSIKQYECVKLLGRDWAVPTKAQKKQGVRAGCSTENCDNHTITKVLKSSTTGKEYCLGYVVTSIDATRCASLHRKYVRSVMGCTALPADGHKKSFVNAAQCLPTFGTYVVRDKTVDECMKPSVAQQVRRLAENAGRPVVAVASAPLKAACAVQNKTANLGSCVPATIPDGIENDMPGDVTSGFNCGYGIGIQKRMADCPKPDERACGLLKRTWAANNCSDQCQTGYGPLQDGKPYGYCTDEGDVDRGTGDVESFTAPQYVTLNYACPAFLAMHKDTYPRSQYACPVTRDAACPASAQSMVVTEHAKTKYEGATRNEEQTARVCKLLR